MLYKCEFSWEISKAPHSFSNLLRLGVSLYDRLLKYVFLLPIHVLNSHLNDEMLARVSLNEQVSDV